MLGGGSHYSIQVKPTFLETKPPRRVVFYSPHCILNPQFLQRESTLQVFAGISNPHWGHSIFFMSMWVIASTVFFGWMHFIKF